MIIWKNCHYICCKYSVLRKYPPFICWKTILIGHAIIHGPFLTFIFNSFCFEFMDAFELISHIYKSLIYIHIRLWHICRMNLYLANRYIFALPNKNVLVDHAYFDGCSPGRHYIERFNHLWKLIIYITATKQIIGCRVTSIFFNYFLLSFIILLLTNIDSLYSLNWNEKLTINYIRLLLISQYLCLFVTLHTNLRC